MSTASESPVASVSLERGATSQEVEAVREAFISMGTVPADVANDYERRSAGALPWHLMIDGSFTGVGLALGGGVVTGAGIGLRKLFRALFHARETSQAPIGSITIIDNPTNVWINVNKADLDAPDDHWQRLAEMDLSQEGGDSGNLSYDPEKGWVPPW